MMCSFRIYCELFFSGADLSCSYSADFGADARVEWKFQDMKGSQTYVFYDGKLTGEWIKSVLFLVIIWFIYF